MTLSSGTEITVNIAKLFSFSVDINKDFSNSNFSMH